MTGADNRRPAPDHVLVEIADYVVDYVVEGTRPYEAARWSLVDALGCALAALGFPACMRLLGPIVPGTVVPQGARVPGTGFELDPVQAAFTLGTMIRWLDFNDTWLAAEWGHPSDNLGAILAVADWQARRAAAAGGEAPRMRDVLTAMIKAYEIQGCLGLDNAFNRVGLDHVVLVKVASTAVVAGMLGLPRERVVDALSQAFVDGQALRTYRHAPNTGARKSWAAGDATARGVRLALLAAAGMDGCPAALTTARWGFYDVSFAGQPFRLQRPFGSYVIENVLYKVAHPAEFHAQSAVEAALRLHGELEAAGRSAADIRRIVVRTHEAALRIIDKSGPLYNPADRDHCLQYMVAVVLLFGRLTAADYGDALAADPRIDALRARIECREEPQFTRDYLDGAKRSIANGLAIEFNDGSRWPEVVVEYPLGHARRRDEGLPLLLEKFRRVLHERYPKVRADAILSTLLDPARLDALPVHEFVDLMIR